VTALVLLAALAAPDVIFLSVDTLRADRLGCYGYEHDTTPAIDAFAESGLLFEDAVCEVPLTGPSFGAMLTSRFPRTTGVTRNGLRMPEDVPTITEQFQEAGYQTFCVQSNWTLKTDLCGFQRGFDVYDDDFHKRRWGFIKPERDADEVAAIAQELLAKRDPDRPLFAWIHFSDPHAPYKYHKKFNRTGERPFGKERAHKTRIKYDTEVSYTDHYIAQVLDAIPTENTYVLFVSDHGESLYEHGYLGHGRRIYQHGMHIPLIIRGPGIEPGRTPAPARGIDIGPTLLGLAGLAPVEGMLGLDLSKARAEASRVRVVETYGGAVPKLPGAKALMAERGPQWQGVLLEGWKLMRSGRRHELYYVPEDLGEERNLAAEEAQRVERLAALIDEWDDRHGAKAGEEAELTDDDIQALESLGYIE
jgi:arylsulfatase A-like enzyme